MPRSQQAFISFWWVLAALVLIRIGALIASPAALGPDESQYWFWSRDPAFGYFSKPPLIAWAIAVTTAIFGNAEWAVRLSAPLFHAGAAAFLFLTAKSLFNERVAFWTGVAWLTIPGVALSSFVITTDAPLLFFWSAAIFFSVRIIRAEAASPFDFAALGAAIGFGLLSKYAMIYFVVATAAAAVLAPATRRALLQPALGLTVVIAAILLLPNILWNAANDFQTVSHTAANANWGAELFKPHNLLTFAAEQFAIAGPVFLAAFIWLVIDQRRSKGVAMNQDATTFLFLLALTPLIVVSLQAFISRAHANWAVSAFPSVLLLTVAWLHEHGRAWITKATVGLHAMLALGFAVAISQFNVIDSIGLSKAVREIRGWEEQSDDIAAMADGYDAIMLDDRALMGAMLYYERDSDLEIVAIDPNASTSHHYEAFNAFDPNRHKRVLFVSTLNRAAHVDYRFRSITPLGPKTVSLGGGETRAYYLFDVSDYFGKS